LSLKTRSEKWRRMAREKCHSLDNPLGVMLGLPGQALPSVVVPLELANIS
jgi:hypothetical protein